MASPTRVRFPRVPTFGKIDFFRGMTGRALAVGTLCFVTIGLLGLSSRVAAQSSDEEEDMSTGEITEEVSATDSIFDETSTDDDSSDDSSPPHEIQGIPRPKTPLRPTR